jgi:hypothetical protein
MNEWDGLDLTGEFNHETSTFPTCSNYNGTTCRWRHVQAISVWRCSELRAHGHIEASGAHSREIEVERVAAVDQHLGEVEQQINLQLVAANGVRDQAIRERDDARRELAAAQRNLAQAQTQLRARAAQARPNSTVTSTPAEGSATTSDSDGTTDLKAQGVIDEIVSEPVGGAQRDPDITAANLKEAILKQLKHFMALSTEKLLAHRFEKFRSIGSWQEQKPATPRRPKKKS